MRTTPYPYPPTIFLSLHRSVAPAVSMEYWRTLAKRYGEHLANTQSSEQCIPSLIASGSTIDAVRFYLQRQDVNSALVVAKMAELQQQKLRGNASPCPDASQGSFTPGPGPGTKSSSLLMTGNGIGNGSGNGQAKGNNGMMLALPNGGISMRGGVGDRDASPGRPYLEPLHDPPHVVQTDLAVDNNGNSAGASTHSINSTGLSTDPNARSLVHSVNTHVASWYLSAARPLLAAAQLLSVGDIHACVNTLSLCGEHDLAYAVALCTGIDFDPHLIKVAHAIAMFEMTRMENLNAVSTSSSTTDQPSIQPSIQPASIGLFTAITLLNQITGSIYKTSSVSPATAVAALIKKTPKKSSDNPPQELSRSQLVLYIQEEKGLLLVRYTDKEGILHATMCAYVPGHYLSYLSFSYASNTHVLSLSPPLPFFPLCFLLTFHLLPFPSILLLIPPPVVALLVVQYRQFFLQNNNHNGTSRTKTFG